MNIPLRAGSWATVWPGWGQLLTKLLGILLFPQAFTSLTAPFWVINDPADRLVPLLLPGAAPWQSMSLCPAFPGMFPAGTSHVGDRCVPMCSSSSASAQLGLWQFLLLFLHCHVIAPGPANSPPPFPRVELPFLVIGCRLCPAQLMSELRDVSVLGLTRTWTPGSAQPGHGQGLGSAGGWGGSGASLLVPTQVLWLC